MMNNFTQIICVVGKSNPDGILMLGTGFIISRSGLIVTTKHVVGSDDSRLVLLMPHINLFDEYQDISNTRCNAVPIKIKEIDPIKDLCILQAIGITCNSILPTLGSLDNVHIGDKVNIFGFPHCVEGRRVLTYQETEIGAKILLDSNGVKSKHAVINTQSRPGQSGSMIYHQPTNSVVGVLTGAYAPHSGISIGGINPRELHQTSHCISAEYINKML